MASPLNQLQTGLSIWREQIDDAAAAIPVAGTLFSRRWRILHIESGAMRYCDGKGQSVTLPDALSADEARDLLSSTSQSGPLVLRFASSLGFRRTTHFPSGASAHLNSAAELALPRLSPLPADNTAFAIESRAPSETEPRIDVTLAMVRRSAIESAVERATRLGLQPNAVDLAAADPDAAPHYDLRPGHRPPGSGRSAFKLGAALVLLFSVIALGFFLDARFRLAPQVAALETPAALEASLEAAVTQAAAKSNSGSATLALADLSRRLPDGAYLTNFTYEAGEIRISGLAWDAAVALRALDSAPEFVSATFSDATVRDEETGRQRFQIVARHRVVEGSVR
tara:strand:+ start:1840 stop:2859 length:1020 start_codon:yes stop_codon:yes gene_type:complete